MSIATIPAGFDCSYSGYTFDPEYTVTTGISIRPVEDAAQRTTVFNEFTISLRTHIAGDLTSSAVIDARRRLTKSGGVFRYRGRGLGDLDINTSQVRDVSYGPKCRELNVKLLGRKNWVQLDWTVVVRMPDCSQAVYAFAPMSLNYTVEFQIRKNGRTNRVVSGELMIPNNRTTAGSKLISDSPDDYREKIVPPIPRGFNRTYAPWIINEARTSLKFGWTDSEFDNDVYPVGCVEAKFSQTTNSREGLVSYVTTFTGEYELAPGYPVEVAERAFFLVVRDRLTQSVARTPATPKESANKQMPPPGLAPSLAGTTDYQQQGGRIESYVPSKSSARGWIPREFRMNEPNLYGPHVVTFSFTALIVASRLDLILSESGLWRHDPKASWDSWHASLKDTALHPRGSTRLTFKTNEDRIVDLCGSDRQGDPATRTDVKEAVLSGYVPQASAAWMHYKNNLYIEGDSGRVETITLPIDDIDPGFDGTAQPPTIGGLPRAIIDSIRPRINSGSYTPPRSTIPGLQPYGSPAPGPPSLPGGGTSIALPSTVPADDQGFGAAVGSLDADFINDDPFPIQQRTRPSCYVIMHGSAMRAGLPIPCPELTDVEGVIPVLVNRVDRGEGFNCGVIANGGNIPIYGATWRLRYFLSKAPEKPIVPPPNPFDGG